MRSFYATAGLLGFCTGLINRALATSCSELAYTEYLSLDIATGAPHMVEMLESVRSMEMLQNAQGDLFSLCLNLDGYDPVDPWILCARLPVSEFK